MIRTVLGDISAESLGSAQCHEHLLIARGRSFDVNPALLMDELDKSTVELINYHAAGGNAVVDAQPVYCGRMASALTAASQHADVHVIAVTGFHKTVFYLEEGYPFTASETELTDLFESEVMTGMIDENGIRIQARAGMVKSALDAGGIHRDRTYEKLFAAAANAALKTNAPILVHTESGSDALEAVHYFTERGIEANRIILCHLDRTHYDFGFHREVLSTGAYLCYDSINRLKYLSNKQETDLILAMLAAGYGEQLLLSLDTTRTRLRAYGGVMGLDYIQTVFLPELRKLGVSELDIQHMTKDNAAQALQMKEQAGK